MTELSVHTELLRRGATDPLAGWLLPSALVLGGVMAAALIGAALGMPRSASIGEPVAHELPTMIAMPVPQSVRLTTAPAAVAQPPFAFGFLEFDWDPTAGVPGFDSWPTREPRIVEAGARN